MSAAFDDVTKRARALSPAEKAALARVLIEDLDKTVDADVENLWIAEAQRRYEDFRRGDLEARPGDEVMRRARDRLR